MAIQGEMGSLAEIMMAWHRVLRLIPKHRLIVLCVLMVIGGASEGLGLLLLVPLLKVLADDGAGANGGVVAQLPFLNGDAHELATLGLGAVGMLAVFLCVIVVRCAVVYWRDLLSLQVRAEICDELRMQCFAALAQAQWKWLVTQKQSDQLSVLTTEIGRVGVGLLGLITVLANLVTAAIYLWVAVTLSWPMTVLAALGGVAGPWILSRRKNSSRHLGHDVTQANFRLQSIVQQGLLGLKTIKGHGAEQKMLAETAQAAGEMRRVARAFMAHSGMAKAFAQVFGAAVLCAYLLVGLTLWPVPIGALITLVVVFARLIPIGISTQQAVQKLSHQTAALDVVFAMRASAEQHGEHRGDRDIVPEVKQGITLSSVYVYRDQRDRPVLQDVSAKIPAGCVTAVIGPSGAGKTTLVDLLTGLIGADSGSVHVDGVDLQAMDLNIWRRKISYVPQDVFFFNDTIIANLVWGLDSVDEGAINNALHLASAGFVDDLPKGLHTIIGDDGHSLSGGERQRLALARALLRNPVVLILDEATNALDRENEQRILDVLSDLKKHRELSSMTVIVISHRRTITQCADQVIVLGQGRVIGQGMVDDAAVKEAIERVLG